MQIPLKAKYRTYGGDRPAGAGAVERPRTQYGFGRKGNGNGRRAPKVARPTNRVSPNYSNPSVLVVDGLTGSKSFLHGDAAMRRLSWLPGVES